MSLSLRLEDPVRPEGFWRKISPCSPTWAPTLKIGCPGWKPGCLPLLAKAESNEPTPAHQEVPVTDQEVHLLTVLEPVCPFGEPCDPTNRCNQLTCSTNNNLCYPVDKSDDSSRSDLLSHSCPDIAPVECADTSTGPSTDRSGHLCCAWCASMWQGTDLACTDENFCSIWRWTPGHGWVRPCRQCHGRECWWPSPSSTCSSQNPPHSQGLSSSGIRPFCLGYHSWDDVQRDYVYCQADNGLGRYPCHRKCFICWWHPCMQRSSCIYNQKPAVHLSRWLSLQADRTDAWNHWGIPQQNCWSFPSFQGAVPTTPTLLLLVSVISNIWNIRIWKACWMMLRSMTFPSQLNRTLNLWTLLQILATECSII